MAEEAYATARNLSVAWIDYHKAFDKVPPPLAEVCVTSHTSPCIRPAIDGNVMGLWRTSLEIPMRDNVDVI